MQPTEESIRINFKINAIGGYFDLELRDAKQKYHETPYALNSGRASLNAILKVRKPIRVYLPYYICSVVNEVVESNSVSFEYYSLGEDLEIVNPPVVSKNELILYVDYFGLKGEYVANLEERYRDKLIIDASQSFFSKGRGVSWQFNSARKFFGVPDGAFLYLPQGEFLSDFTEWPENHEYIFAHLLTRQAGDPIGGYPAFIENERRVSMQIMRMSTITKRLLSLADYNSVIKQRQINFDYLYDRLGQINQINFARSTDSVPFCYPFIGPRHIDRNELARKYDIFIPRYWPGIDESRVYKIESKLSHTMLPLPVDHRYGEYEMKMVANSVESMVLA